MATNNRTAQPARRNTRHIFAHSVYITKAWDWLLEFVGRAAEAILVASVLYASVKLLPVVHMPSQLDVIVFIAQFVALDVGGLSLNKLAKQARSERNEAGAIQAGRMSQALITVMIAGVVVVAIEQLFAIPGNWKLGIDTVLLIARSILAVLYGHIIHSLKTEEGDGFPLSVSALDDPWPMVGLSAYLLQTTQQMIEGAIAETSANYDRRLATIADEQASIKGALQQIQDTPTLVPTIDTQAIAGNVLAILESRFTSEMKVFQANLRQQVSVTLANEMAEVVTNERQKNSTIMASDSSVTGQVNHSSTITRKLPAITEKHAAVTPENVRQFPQRTTTADDTGAAVIRAYLEDTSRSQRAIAALVGTSEATVNRRLKEYLGTAQTPTTSTDVTA